MQTIELRLSDGIYPAYIGQHLLAQGLSWPAPLGQNRLALVCLDRVLEKHWPHLATGLSAAGWTPDCLLLEAGESLKDFAQLYPLYGELLQRGLQRRSLLVAVGGGSVGDAVGFLAATYLRGLDWVNVPTSLLAQVDSCLGGKTGMNHAAGKNLIGAIYQPCRILCDIAFLRQLPDREWLSGLGEMLKYGLIHDPAFWDWLVAHQAALLQGQHDLLETAIARSLAIKASFVSQDVADLNGVRAALNFGHTFGHALEQLAGYGYYRHGEAVILGMSLACRVSQALGYLSAAQAHSICRVLEALPLPPVPLHINASALVAVMHHDKKNDGQQIQCLLLKAPGRVFLQPCEAKLLESVLQKSLKAWHQS